MDYYFEVTIKEIGYIKRFKTLKEAIEFAEIEKDKIYVGQYCRVEIKNIINKQIVKNYN